MNYDPTWPASQRLRVVAAILLQIQSDIPAGRYSQPGRPNCQSALHIACDPAPELHEAMDDPAMRQFVTNALALENGR